MATSERTIGQLVADSVDDVRAIIQHEKALAKAEITRAAKTGGVGAGLLAGAAAMLGLSVIYLLIAAAEGLVDAGMTRWGAYLVVGGVLLLLGVVLGVVGALVLKKVSGPKRTVEQGKGTVQDVKGALSSDDDAAPGGPGTTRTTVGTTGPVVGQTTGRGATAVSRTGAAGPRA